MLVLAVVVTALYAFVNAFGAWMVIRRKTWIAALFMLAATMLVVAAAAFISVVPCARVLLIIGLVLASLASFLNARIVLGHITPRNHLIRAAIAVLIYVVAEVGL
ncbi:MAG: hypothetical protein U5L04_02910 [Trueperaceae bacterium]|nr:hypothetical protein [Trueperaceae bacterium]